MSALAAGSGQEGNLGHGRLAALGDLASALGTSVVFDIAWPSSEHAGYLASGAALKCAAIYLLQCPPARDQPQVQARRPARG